MRTPTRNLVLIPSFVLIFALAAPATGRAQSLLPPDTDRGDRVTVTTANGTRLSGRLSRDDGGELVIRRQGRDETIRHAEVTRVDRHRNRFLLGPLVGLGAGLAVGLPLERRFDNEAANGNTALALSVALGVGVGTVIDLFNGSSRTIYTR